MVDATEVVQRLSGRVTHRLASLPILALNVHTACNCSCVMCDIWMANANGRQLTADELDHHLSAISRLGVQRVMLTGGEPLLHRNLWRLCAMLRDRDIAVTLVTTGLLLAAHADAIAAHVDEVVISIDGPPEVHDRIRRIAGGFARISRGVQRLRDHAHRPRLLARSVVQRLNHAFLAQTTVATRDIGVERLSFLAADVSSPAFNRPIPWSAERRAEVALSIDDLPALAASIREVETRCESDCTRDFIAGGPRSLWRIHQYYGALLGIGRFPDVRCNAPWVSAVLEPGGVARPCFFHAPYEHTGGTIQDMLNSASAVAFRRQLDVHRNETCRRCVCTLSLKPWQDV